MLPSLKDNWIEVEAETEIEARIKMINCFERMWAFIYTEATFKPYYFPGGKVGRTIK